MDTTFSYQCHAFHEALPDEKASGQLSVNEQGISFNVNSINGLFPLENLIIHLGGASNRIVFITHPSAPEITLYTSDLSILNNSVLRAHSECRTQLNFARKKRHSGWVIFSVIVLCLLSLPIGIFFQMDYVSSQIAKQIPTEWETKLGQSVAAQYRMTHKLMPKEQTENLLKPLATPLLTALKNSRFNYQFTIVNDGDLNAFALPGGFLTINSGLILKAESAEELLGVMAHEISHVEARHGVRSIIGKAGVYLIASTLLGDIQGLLATVSSAAPMLISQQYSRQFENDADENAVKLLQRANINPKGLPIFFEKMILEEQKVLANIENKNARTAYKKAMSILNTHPTNEERINHLKKLIADNHRGENINLENEFKTLQDAVKDFVANTQDITNNAKNNTPTKSGINATAKVTEKGDAQ